MKIFYIILGCMYLAEDELFVQNNYIKNTTSVSNNVFERKLYEGFQCSPLVSNFVFISAPSVGWFPMSCKRLVMKDFSSKSDYLPISYVTTYLGTSFSKAHSLKNGIKKVLKTIDLNKYEVCLILNELHFPYLKCAEFIKKSLPRSTTIQLVPDLPEFNNRSKQIIYKILKRINCKTISCLRKKYIDKYVLFSKEMAERLEIDEFSNWIVNYGISPDAFQHRVIQQDGQRHVVFVGKIDKRNGVDLILQVAELFSNEEDIVFDLYGIGASDSANECFTKRHSNVLIHGFVNPSDISSILSSADVLISPRYPDEEYTRYSFPSKIFEYLQARKPIVTFKLDCYPEELDNILIYPESVTADSLSKSIRKAFLSEVNYAAIESFLSMYSKEAVVKRIIELVE